MAKGNPFPKIFELGYLAFLTGKTVYSKGVPYQTIGEPSQNIKRNLDFLREWRRGYDAAYFDNKKVLLNNEEAGQAIRASKSFSQYFEASEDT